MDTISPEAVGFSPKRLRHIDTTMRRYVNEGKLAGVVTLLARQGKVLQQGCYGMADREARKAMQPDSLFRIWSMTKSITAVATMILYEEGHFALDQDIADFLPEFKSTKVFVNQTGDRMETVERERPITVRQLLTHTAGIVSGSGNHPVEVMAREEGVLWMQTRPSLARMVKALANLPLIYQPFTHWHYSLAFDVAARLIEVISGQYFDEFLKERIFDPLGMTDTGYVVTDEQFDRFTAFYRKADDDSLQVAITPEDSLEYQWRDLESGTYYTSGGSNLISTAPDYLRFAQMLLNKGELDGERILSPHTVSLMTTNQLPPHLLPCQFPDAQPIYGYGHGLGVHTLMDRGLAGTPCANGEFWKDGGAGTLFWADPQYDLIGIVMYQLVDFWMYPVFAQFRALAYQAMLA
jgi:CubicO group peptidase (beta-lactamase class C family)